MSSIYILWDESHIWGLLVWRAIEAMQLPYRIVRGQEIAHGLLSGKTPESRPALLLVPGGNARQKSEALGVEGIRAIREYVREGGSYLGFCGGAGLGLSSADGLCLCPWGRAKFTDRMQHFVSGHIHATLHASPQAAQQETASVPDTTPATGSDLIPPDLGPSPLVPIWWPARFAPETGTDVQVLASYADPGEDFWVADLPLGTLPPGTFNAWEDLYDIKLRPTFLTGQPCVLSGAMGSGRYVLSYTHLETPDSPEANRWLAHIISVLSKNAFCPQGLTSPTHTVPPWNPSQAPMVWTDPALAEARAIFEDIVTIGKNHCLFFQRNAWLIGWRAGIPGANLNNLYCAICSVVSTPPTKAALDYWNSVSDAFLTKLRLFHEGVRGYLLAERLAMTLSKTFPETVSHASLKNQRAALFGPPMASGGLYLELLDTIDTVMYLLLPGASPQYSGEKP
ncbi:BPL-N domain-containing protein [Desulfovibrio psychrotolerans]|uniref:Biotin-protein ligase N-terminal domain-containing protein n=1 Tax=Desulfovibrio psychrotolerans TaxID=415242 RepID=A0A7J0BS55_9BACT|nr:BPL-N domain-containing protein [Desulfovibrio psychrotolerans]GFM35985.1 hypothetical protein DSM19430T_06690 [Desulfovibrio psychrotolerans]